MDSPLECVVDNTTASRMHSSALSHFARPKMNEKALTVVSARQGRKDRNAQLSFCSRSFRRTLASPPLCCCAADNALPIGNLIDFVAALATAAGKVNFLLACEIILLYTTKIDFSVRL